ncbi:ADP-L-glycero-D-manno-heptose-6-epimerase [Desulfurobacterium thermolithotrophum DSM 11699]|uniref:ADP-L-glycero-D-manno-heptose-6-epimerase n=1 Tax=Desulfurobacterium thermolithotrophum (strain DSM 11699 / BSA) TaxID=868864 RepID=F0S2W0_DESTD|nr:ADP-glyceromanno-heptose 6-epimerase [Desulfurobacterium thermolithotrophum]ADY73182.1 ADP-L-glycero-D-manno-heptose-6-epimerase [Desulfurobacterium thermolithotrophum DSM 11699]
MKALVTGGAGFIGSNLALELQKRYKDIEVFVLDDFSSGHFKNLIGFEGEIITGSITEPETIEKLRKYGFDVIFHQAANANTTDTNQRKMMEANYEAFKDLLEIARESKAKVIYASSAAVYGNGPAPMKVNQELLPENIYGFSKYAMDMLAYKFMKENPTISVVGLRYFNVYGPRETYKGKMASMVLQLTVQIMKGKRPRLFKWGEQKRDFVYVMDCIEANIKSFEANKSGIVNIGTGKARSFNEIVDVIRRTLNVDVEIEYFDNPYDFYQNYTEADLTETKEILNWYPGTQIEEGIPAYIKWIKENVNINKLPY